MRLILAFGWWQYCYWYWVYIIVIQFLRGKTFPLILFLIFFCRGSVKSFYTVNGVYVCVCVCRLVRFVYIPFGWIQVNSGITQVNFEKQSFLWRYLHESNLVTNGKRTRRKKTFRSYFFMPSSKFLLLWLFSLHGLSLEAKMKVSKKVYGSFKWNHY